MSSYKIREKDNQCVLSLTLENGQRKEMILGAYIIKESMAAMYQSLADRAAEHDDIPYNVVRLIAEDYYKNVCYDIRKLISICYLSLYSMQPATVLLDQMRFANANPQMSRLNIVIKFIQENHIVKYDSDGRKAVMSVTDFFNFVVTRFEKILGKLIGNTTFISESIQRVNISTGFVPIIQILYENDPFDRNSFNTLVKGCGIPHIYTEFSEEHWPSCVCDSKKTNIASNDVLQLFVLNAMYEYLTNNRFACPLLSYCNKKDDADCKNILWKDECYGTPWEGRECFMTMVANFIGIQDKKII